MKLWIDLLGCNISPQFLKPWISFILHKEVSFEWVRVFLPVILNNVAVRVEAHILDLIYAHIQRSEGRLILH